MTSAYHCLFYLSPWLCVLLLLYLTVVVHSRNGLPPNCLELSTVLLFSKLGECPRKWERKKTVKSFIGIKHHNYMKCTNTV